MLDRFGGWHDPIAEVLEGTDPETVLRNDVYDRRPLRRWSDGNVVVIGDAAHPMQPNLGQGACQALEDAAALAAILAERPTEVSAALERFEAGRRPTAERVVARARRLGQVAQAANPLTAALRNALARATPASATLRGMRSFAAAR